MVFERAVIKVEKEKEFAELRNAIENVFQPAKTERFLKQLDRHGIRIRDFDGLMKAKTLEDVTGVTGLKALQLYQSLTISDQAQMREFYLSQLEAVDVALRHRFKRLYQYY